MSHGNASAVRPVLRLVSDRPQAADHLQELRRAIDVAGVLLLVLTDELAKAKASLSVLEGGAA